MGDYLNDWNEKGWNAAFFVLGFTVFFTIMFAALFGAVL